MPTYEYACSTCDATHEVQQKMTDPTLTECPVCGKATVRKLFSGVGVHFKGSGFYRTDSRSVSDTSTSSSKSSDSSSSKSSDSSSSKSSDSSSASKSSDSSSSSSSSSTSTTKTASTTS
ncbi:MAG: zinc ribbon domain-containing protein [Candidatus Nanopelagicales bacterium]|nr:zinc ribbon domain-containing protein [Candidatus Nanopelagicales bacterium]MCF8542815.1 zinc ribbon domain-containing protein [Candidatus Nanopelagicales bacterium]MCF8557299.1 zinc ribbon domain-containing protein [Candidatus Nanopelagicales bacterium]